MPGVHRMTDLCSPHPCPPFGPPGAGSPTVCAMGCATVLVNALPACVLGCLTMIHPCIAPDLPPGPHVGVYLRNRTVLAQGRPLQAMGDLNCCAAVLSTGSPNVIVGA